MIDEIAESLGEIRPELGTLSIDDLTNDLEAATQALEAELITSVRKQGEAENSVVPLGASTPNRLPVSASENAAPSADAEISVMADADADAETTDTNADTEIENADEQALKTLVAKAVTSSRAQIYLQPILGLATRRAESFEVLAHLESDQGDMLAPSNVS